MTRKYTTTQKTTQENQDTLASITHPHLTTKLNNMKIPRNTFSLYHTNIDSLIPKHPLLTEHMNRFTHNTPDIITITDNYMTGDINDNLLPIPTYTSIHIQDVSVYYKTNLHVTTITDIHIRQVFTTIIQIHNTQAKTDASRTIISLYRRTKDSRQNIHTRPTQHDTGNKTTHTTHHN